MNNFHYCNGIGGDGDSWLDTILNTGVTIYDTIKSNDTNTGTNTTAPVITVSSTEQTQQAKSTYNVPIFGEVDKNVVHGVGIAGVLFLLLK